MGWGYHLYDHGVGVRVGHHPCERASARHAKSARVVDEDEVGAAFFDEFGGEADSYISCH